MKILITGNYQPTYNRNLVVFSGLVQKNVALIYLPYTEKDSKKTISKQLAQYAQKVDAVYIPAFRHEDVRFVKKNIGGKLLIFDPLISRYLSKVFDYQKVWKYSPRALKNYLKDYRAMHAADIVLADTQAHQEYYIKTIKVPAHKIVVVPVGVDTKVFYPSESTLSNPSQASTFKVGFYGSFVPLQGVLKIAQAAKILEYQKNIFFEIIGGGFDSKKLNNFLKKEQLSNLQIQDWVPYEQLPGYIQNWDLALGIFGDSLKADLVIPNKIYHYLACAKCTLTKDSPAIREAFAHQQEIYLCEATPKTIAEGILQLSEDATLRQKIAHNGLECIKNKYDAPHIAQKIINAIQAKI